MSSNSKNNQEKNLNKSNTNSKIINQIKKEDIILLIMDFLKNEGYDRTYVSLEEESGINLYNYDENLGILRGFILDGDWEEAEKSLEIFKSKKNFPFKNLIFEIRKEKLIEEVEAQQKDGTFDGLAKELKDLQDLGCNKEFNNLMDYLKETEHDVLNETISRRLEIFNKIRKQITFQYPITNNELNIQPNKLKEIFSNIIEKFLVFNKNIKKENNIYNLKDIDDLLNIKFELENIIDSDTNKNTIIYNNSLNNYKDSFNESKNNSSKRKNNTNIRNQKSAMERLAETYDDLDIYIQDDVIDNNKKSKTQKKKTSTNKENRVNKNINNKKSLTKQNTNYLKNYINDKKKIKKEPTKNKSFTKSSKSSKSNKNIKDNKNNNAKIDDNYKVKTFTNNIKSNYYSNKILDTGLSDLDQDEYFFKNCYDYYNYDITSLYLKKVISDTHPIRCCCFSPKGDYFAIGTNSKCVKIYDLSYILDSFTKRNNNIFPQIPINRQSNTNSIISNSKINKESISLLFEQKNYHFGSIFSIDWSPSGHLLATGSNDKTIKLMTIPDLYLTNNNEKKIFDENEATDIQITGNQGTVRSLCFEPNNDSILLSANSGENTIKIWDTLKGVNIGYLEGHISDVNSVKWSNDSQLFASCALDKTIRFWDIRENKNINILSAIQYADINDIAVFSSSNNIIVAVGHTDGLMTIWDYSKQCVIKEIYEHNEQIRSVAFSPDGKYLLSGAFDSKIKIYDINDNFKFIGEIEHGDKVVSCKWHPDIPLIISTSADKTARVWIPSKF